MLDRTVDVVGTTVADRSVVPGDQCEVIAFPARQIDPQAPEQKLLDMLEMVREGKIESIAIAYATKDGAVGTGYSSTKNVGMLIGAVTLLQSRLCND